MPPRLELFSALRIRNASKSICPLNNTSRCSASTQAQKRRHQDPYALAQARARKAANVSRQEVLRTERAKAYGDPIRGMTTAFIESFDTAQAVEGETNGDAAHTHLNHFLNEAELQHSIQHSNLLSTPISTEARGQEDPLDKRQAEAKHKEGHANAREALSRIVALDNSSSQDRTRTNIERCIEKFGRHNTDNYLAPRPAVREEGQVVHEKTPRAGPDTGSSEVQISILTAKIRTLANFLDNRGRKDNANKRNLRLLVHKRQKLLAYMRKKERGGERWQHLIQTLGLTEGTWKGEITV